MYKFMIKEYTDITEFDYEMYDEIEVRHLLRESDIEVESIQNMRIRDLNAIRVTAMYTYYDGYRVDYVLDPEDEYHDEYGYMVVTTDKKGGISINDINIIKKAFGV